MSGLQRDFETNLARVADTRISSSVDHGGSAAGNNKVQQTDPRAPRFRRGYSVNSESYSRVNTFALDNHDYGSPQKSRYEPRASLRQPVSRQRSATYTAGDFSTADEEDDNHSHSQTTGADRVVMTGWLYKMSRLQTSKATSHRQRRRFRLTAHSLECDQPFQKVAIFSII